MHDAATMLILILILFAMAAALLATGIALTVRYFTRRDRLSIAVGGLAIPALILGGLLYWLATIEVDDAPPGAVILGNLLLVAITAPVGWLACYLTIRTLTARALRKSHQPPIA